MFLIADQADLAHSVEPGIGTQLSKESPKWSRRLLGGRYDVAGLAAVWPLKRAKREGAMEMLFTRRADEPQSGRDFGSLTEDLRRVLRTELLKDSCSAANIARLFSVHRRTMSRHLRTEGLAFRQVANEIRFEIACELLENTDMALGQIAAVLRYSELSAFTRAFRRWSGQSPSAWRGIHLHIRKSRRLRKPRRLRAHPDPGGRSGPSNKLS